MKEQYVSLDLLFPQCATCETNLFVQRSTNPEMYTFYCVQCENGFNPSHESPWHGVDSLPRFTREDYLQTKIRGLSHREQAERRNVSRSTVTENVNRAIRHLDASNASQKVTERG